MSILPELIPFCPIHYTVTPLLKRHVYNVQLRIAPQDAAFVDLTLPNWIAGSYMLRDFARHIVSISATDKNGAVVLTPTSQFGWRSASFEGELTVAYEVFAHDTSVRTAFLDGEGGFFNATSLCLMVGGLERTPHGLTLVAPENLDGWSVATTLPRCVDAVSRGFGGFVAANYDELSDHPVRFGDLTWVDFEAHGVPHEVALAGCLPYLDVARLRADLVGICEAQLELFEPTQPSSAPFERFVFMVDVRGTGYGGLEHRSSTALLCERADLPTLAQGELPRSEAYINFLGLCSHEYFHSWNVKRIKPAEFVPYDLTRVVDTTLLWFFEGVTSHYDDLMLFRAGIIDEAQYLKKIDTTFNAVVRHDGSTAQSVAASGFYAWTKYYQASANTPNAVVSYYSKGALIALAMDCFIRENSGGVHSLDDVMRDLWLRFGRDFYVLDAVGQARGVVEGDIVETVSRFASADAAAWLHEALHGISALPLKMLLATQGVMLSEPVATVAQLGATTKKIDGGWQINRVLNGSAAQLAGLSPDDVLIAFDKLRLNVAPDDALAKIQIGANVCVHYWRDDVLAMTTFINSPAPHGVYSLSRELCDGDKPFLAAL